MILLGFRLFTEDQGSKLSCIVLCVGSIAMAHSLHPFDPCSLYTFSLLCLMKQNALHSFTPALFDLHFNDIEFKHCDTTRSRCLCPVTV